MGSITILSGRADSGKSTELYDRIADACKKREQVILIVPAQYTFEAERRVCDRLGGLIGAEVYSLERLSERIVRLSGKTLPVLSKQGRCMVIRRVVLHHADELQLWGRVALTRGFAEQLDGLIRALRECCVEPEQLKAAAKKQDPDSLLGRKLHDLALLYAATQQQYQTQYHSVMDQTDLAAELVGDSFVRHCRVFLDDLIAPTAQQLRLLGAIASAARSVTLTLRIDDGPDAALFEPDRRSAQRIGELAAARGLTLSTLPLQRKAAADRDPALAALERGLFDDGAAPYPKETDAVQLFGAPDRAREAALVADLVLERARLGVRYRDMAVVVSDMNAYVPLLRRAFRARNIPLFFDATRPILGHAAAELLLSAARAASGGFNTQELLRILKSGYAGVERADVELFENYLLRYGLYGSGLTEPLHFGEVPEAAERVRSVLMPPLMALREGLSRGSVEQKARAIYEYLCALDLKTQLMAQAEQALSEGRSADAEAQKQVWNTLMELLSQLYTILGKEKLSAKDFQSVLEEGIAGYSMGVLPGTSDQVLLGDLERTRTRPVDSLFVLGVNDGLLPLLRGDDEILSNEELSLLREAGLTLWGDSYSLIEGDRLEIYSALTKARRRLCLSYALADGAETLAPSSLIDRVERLFPAARCDALRESALPSCKAEGFSRMAAALCIAKRDGSAPKELGALIDCYREDPAYRERLHRILSEREGRLSPTPFGSSLSEALYGRAPSMSASRLEQFNSCPFRQYIVYGLKAAERREAKEDPADEGSFLHEGLDAFARTLAAQSLDWATLDDARLDQILDELLPPLIAAHNDGLLLRDPRLKATLSLRIDALRRCILAIREQLAAGRFRPLKTELSFGMDGGLPPVQLQLSNGRVVLLRGRVDRVDRSPDGLLRVIDYKTHGKPFDPAGVYDGELLQLPLYLCAIKGLGGEVVGAYYMPLLPPPTDEDGEAPSYAMSGVTATDVDALAATAITDEDRAKVVKGLKRGGASGCERGGIAYLGEMALARAAVSAERMLNGDAAIHPIDKACDYCPLKSICRFDEQLPACRKRHLPALRLDELIALPLPDGTEP